MAKRKKKTKKGKWESLKDTDNMVVMVPRSTQDLIPISTISKSGTFEIEKGSGGDHLYDRVYAFSDVNFTTKDYQEREDILIKYCTVLNSLNVNFKIVIASLTRDEKELSDIRISKGSASNIEKTFAKEYNGLIDDKLLNRTSHIDQKKYIIITAKKKTYEDADAYFDQIETQLSSDFGAIGSEIRKVSGVERLELLHRAYHVTPQVHFIEEWHDFLKTDFRDDLAPLDVELIDRGAMQYLKIDNHYACTLVIKKDGFPRQLSNKFMQRITDLAFPSIVTLDIVPIPQDLLLDTLQKKLDNVESKIVKQQEVRNKNEQYSTDITRAVQREKENIEKYMDEVADNDQSMFFSQILITIYAESVELLESRIENIRQIGRSMSVDLSPYCMQQLEAFNTALPLGGRFVNTMCRTLFTNALVCFVPFNVQELYQRKGKYYGINQLSKKLIIGDRRKLLNGNGWIFGVPGTGKSFAAKMEMGQILAGSDDDIIIIDPQNEYAEFIGLFGGQYINLSATSNNHINPLEIDPLLTSEHAKDFITLKSEFTMDILTQMAGKELTMIQKSCVDKATRQMYFDVFRKPRSEWVSPTFLTLQKYLYAMEDDEAKELAAGLYAFAEGSLNLFAHQSNVKLNNRFIAFGTKDLGKGLTRVSMLIMLEAIRNRVSYNQSIGKVTWVYVDEAHELTAEEFTAKSLERSYKEVRKQGGIITGITQNVTDCLLNKTTRTMVANSEFMLLLGQANVDLDPLLNVVDVSRNELRYVQTEKQGHGLLRFGKTVIPFDNEVEKESRLYELFNTNIHEKIEAGYFNDKVVS